jgi:phosphoglycolate phosphatase
MSLNDGTSASQRAASSTANRYDVVIFDFDGTLADSGPWFRSVMNDVAKHFGFRAVGEEEFEALRGRPAHEVVKLLGVPRWKLPFIARHFRKLMSDDSVQIFLFDGIDELLAALTARGLTIVVASSNSEANVRRVLGEKNVRHIAHFACGIGLLGKARVFRALVRKTKTTPSRVLSIGDELRDIEASRKAGLSTGAVPWGYGSADSLRAQVPDHMFESVAEILDAVTIRETSS